MESTCVHRSNIGWRISNTERINPWWEACEQGVHSSEVQNSLPFFTDLLLMRNNPCFIWFSFFCGPLIFFSSFSTSFRFWLLYARYLTSSAKPLTFRWLWRNQRISLTFYEIPGLFPDLEKSSFFRDFSLWQSSWRSKRMAHERKKIFVFLTLFNGHFTKFFKSFDLLRATNQWQGVRSDC